MAIVTSHEDDIIADNRCELYSKFHQLMFGSTALARDKIGV
jgi:hypothetical protein